MSTVGNELVPACLSASVRKTKVVKTDSRSIIGMGGTTKTKRTMQFWFYFGGRLYHIIDNVFQGRTPVISSHRDLNNMGLNYQSMYKIIERPEDGYTEHVDWRCNLPYLVFTSYGHFSDEQIRTMHRNLGHPTLERQMKVIENSKVSGLSPGLRKSLKEIIDHCRPCQLMRAKPRRFLFSIKDDLTGEFNHTRQIDAVHLSDGNVLHVVCVGTGFQQGLF